MENMIEKIKSDMVNYNNQFLEINKLIEQTVAQYEKGIKELSQRREQIRGSYTALRELLVKYSQDDVNEFLNNIEQPQTIKQDVQEENIQEENIQEETLNENIPNKEQTEIKDNVQEVNTDSTVTNLKNTVETTEQQEVKLEDNTLTPEQITKLKELKKQEELDKQTPDYLK